MTARAGGQRLYLLGVILLVAGTGQGCVPVGARTLRPELAGSQPWLIAVGDSVTDSLSATDPSLADRGPFRAYRFVARAGERYDISLRSTDFDSYLSVVTYVNGVPDLLRDDDGGRGTNSLLRFQPREAGTYLLIAQALERKPGVFTLSVRAASGDAGAARVDSLERSNGASDADTTADAPPQPVVLDVPTDAVLRGPAALYTFHGGSGQPYILELSSVEFDPMLEVGILTPAFSRIASDDDGGSGLNSRLIFTPSADREYAIRVSEVGLEQGRYTLKVGRAPSAIAGPIRIGSVVRGEISSADSPIGERGRPADDWLLAAEAGQRYAATMSAGDSAQLDTYLSVGRIRNGQFSPIASNDDGAGLSRRTDSRVVFTALESGEYVIRAMPYGADTGAYELRIDQLPPLRPAPERRRAVFGRALEGTLDPSDFELADGSYVDEWIISAARTDTLVVTLASTDFDAFLSVGATVDGQFVAYSSNDDAAPPSKDARVVMIPPSSGEYVIRANSISPTAIGRYTLRVEKR